MNKMNLPQAAKLTSPNLVTVVCTEKPEGSTIKIPHHTRVAIQCSLKEYHETGDHYLYICDVEQVYGDETEEALFAWNGYSQLSPAK